MIQTILNNKIYPFLLVFVFVFSYYIENAVEAYVSQTLLPLLLGLLIALVFYVVWTTIFRREDKAAILTTYSLSAVFLHGHVKNLLDEPSITLAGKTFGEDSLVILMWGVLGIAVLLLVIRAKDSIESVTKSLNIVVLVMIISNLILFAGLMLDGKVVVSEVAYKGKVQVNFDGPIISDDLPDIYHIVLDKYASNGVLETYFNYDNSAHTDVLEEMGFYVAYDARTNYPHTLYSLSTTLNMVYANELAEKMNADPKEVNGELNIIYPGFRNHEVGQILTAAGYDYYHTGNWFYPTQTSSSATENYIFNKSQFRLGEFTDKFLQQTILEPLLGK